MARACEAASRPSSTARGSRWRPERSGGRQRRGWGGVRLCCAGWDSKGQP
ncbi:hypothetical protein BN903_198 [Halorubrum sp. AJ67]|nr:hypothetical protein BN903_198 [Halorubrum sp. AJ67]